MAQINRDIVARIAGAAAVATALFTAQFEGYGDVCDAGSLKEATPRTGQTTGRRNASVSRLT